MSNFATLEGIQAYAANHATINIPISGNCMEGRNINNGDIIAVDFTKMPIPVKGKDRDICLMYDKKLGCVGAKEYIGAWGDVQMVSTCPIIDFNKGVYFGWAFSASHILGTVYACYTADGNLKWERDISDRPAVLSRRQAINGANVGKPMSRENLKGIPGDVAV